VNKEEDQRKLQSLMLQIRSYQNTLQEIAKQNALTERAVADLAMVISAIEKLPNIKESEALIPIGAGVFVRGEILDKKQLLVSTSSDILLEKSVTEAKDYLEKRKTKLEEDNANLRPQAQTVTAELENANQVAEELYAKSQAK